ncbi:KTSC domain-containing protein [Sphingobium estronivorans]|uniref:KTSC domain-containing protein n=1 Tax=Sphingobium estronivorans TaxID=1577690 RepID=UPI00123C00F1|nr:KTSC domain-containing protein [Sphingobium estronivorans]
MPSIAIQSFVYDPDWHRLDVQFVSGKRYSYFDVPAEVAEGMRAAASQGGYFNRLIRDRYRFTRLSRFTPP